MAEKKEGNIFKITVIANIVAIIVGGITVVSEINSHIEDITKKQTETVAVFFSKDIRTRLNFLETEIKTMNSKGTVVPELMHYKVKELESQLEDIKTWQEK